MEARHLTQPERAAVNARLREERQAPPYVPDGTWVEWPTWAPKQHNASTDACDMWTGPCACGAWHRDGA